MPRAGVTKTYVVIPQLNALSRWFRCRFYADLSCTRGYLCHFTTWGQLVWLPGCFSGQHNPSYMRSTLKRRWMDDLQFYVLFNSISVISVQWSGDNERQCAMDWWLRRFPPQVGLKSGTTRSVGQHLTYWATGLQLSKEKNWLLQETINSSMSWSIMVRRKIKLKLAECCLWKYTYSP